MAKDFSFLTHAFAGFIADRIASVAFALITDPLLDALPVRTARIGQTVTEIAENLVTQVATVVLVVTGETLVDTELPVFTTIRRRMTRNVVGRRQIRLMSRVPLAAHVFRLIRKIPAIVLEKKP